MPDLTPRPAQRWLSSEEAAAYLTLREGEFLRRVKAGLFAEPSRHLGPRTPRWDRAALDATMTAGTTSARRPLSEAIDAELRARVAELEGLVEATDAAMEFMNPLSNSGMTDTEFANLWNATHEALRAALSPATEVAPE